MSTGTGCAISDLGVSTGASSLSTTAPSPRSKGTSCCKWCRRSQRSPNPYTDKTRYPGEFLPWRREQGRECRSCCNWIKVAKLSRETLERMMQDEEEAAKYLSAVTDYEVMQNAPDRECLIKRGRGGAGLERLGDAGQPGKKARGQG